MARKKKCVVIKKTRRRFWLFLMFLFLVIFFLCLLLEYYLYEMQRRDRILKVTDYSTYVLTYQKQNRCQTRTIFFLDSVEYRYDCLDNIYLTYGTTETTLEEVFTNGYVTLDVFLSKMQKLETEEGKEKYIRHSTNMSMGYQVLIEKKEEQQIVTISSYE